MSADSSKYWLLFVAILARFPTPDDLADFRRRIELSTQGTVILAALESTMLAAVAAASQPEETLRSLRIVESGVVVDVNFCATQVHNTGIQRVVRETMPQWVADGRDVTFVAWTADFAAMRDLTQIERSRVLEWNTNPTARVKSATELTREIVVPWRSLVIMPEVPFAQLCAPLAAIAQSSGNRVSMIGYDTIPLVSAETVVPAESERFAIYLSVVKHADSVVAISESAAEEFRGFASGLPAQGLVGPRITAAPLPSEARKGDAAAVDLDGPPLILCVGSHEPRKNQDAVLYAAEALHREGLDFRLVFIGGGDRARTHPFDRRLKDLRKAGMAVESHRRVEDQKLWHYFSQARFSVFVSLHEGYGLPVAESLSFGTPVITSDFGSLAEIAADGGCLTVDPRSDQEIVGAMRTLLSDDACLTRLVAEIRHRPQRSWSDYSRDLWEHAHSAEAIR